MGGVVVVVAFDRTTHPLSAAAAGATPLATGTSRGTLRGQLRLRDDQVCSAVGRAPQIELTPKLTRACPSIRDRRAPARAAR